MNGKTMKKAHRKTRPADPDLRDEYDFSNGVRGKYADRFKHASGCYLVAIDLELRRYFPDDKSVNRALHLIADLIQNGAKSKPRRKSA
jgi:hypothetical protein